MNPVISQPGLLVKLRPTTPWRIGPSDGARERTDRVLHSDTLYGAVCWAMRMLGCLEEWLDATARHSEGAQVRLTSCFPFLNSGRGDLLLAPPPMNLWPPPPSARLRWKSARFVPLRVIESLAKGETLNLDQWHIDGDSECLLPSGQAGPCREIVRQRAGVDRRAGTTLSHSVAGLEFQRGSGFWCMVWFADETAAGAWNGRIRGAFRLLADSGLGGEKSQGWGRASKPEFREGPLTDLLFPPRKPEPSKKDPTRKGTLKDRFRKDEPAAAETPAQTAEAEEIKSAEAAAEEMIEEGSPVAPEIQDEEEPTGSTPGALPEEAETSEAVETTELEMVSADLTALEATESAITPARIVEEARVVEEPRVVEEARFVEDLPSAHGSAIVSGSAQTLALKQPTPVASQPGSATKVAAETPPRAKVTYSNLHWLLSLYTPGPDENINWKLGDYDIVVRGGHVENGVGTTSKKRLRMVSEGSVLHSENGITGVAPSVEYENQVNYTVFHSGFAVTIPLFGISALDIPKSIETTGADTPKMGDLA